MLPTSADPATANTGLTIGGVGAASKYVSQLLKVAQGAAANPQCRCAPSYAVHVVQVQPFWR